MTISPSGYRAALEPRLSLRDARGAGGLFR